MRKNLSLLLLAAVAAGLLLMAASCTGGGGQPENISFTWLASGGNDVQLDAVQLVNGQEITSYHWDFGDGNSQTTTQDIVHHIYSAAGDYTVTLTGHDAAGNTYTATQVASASP